jgi:hypothetical protein
MRNKKCILCDGQGYIDSISDCCSEQRNPDTQICSYCHDFCGAVKCPECDGRGVKKLKKRTENLLKQNLKQMVKQTLKMKMKMKLQMKMTNFFSTGISLIPAKV